MVTSQLASTKTVLIYTVKTETQLTVSLIFPTAEVAATMLIFCVCMWGGLRAKTTPDMVYNKVTSMINEPCLPIPLAYFLPTMLS